MLNRNTDSGQSDCDLLVVSNSCVVSARAPEKQKADSVNEFLLVEKREKLRDVTESPPLNLIYVVSINFNSLKGSIKLDLMVETLFVKKCLQFLRVSPTTHLVMTQDT